MGLCIIMLKHEVMAVDEWHNNGPQALCAFKLPSTDETGIQPGRARFSSMLVAINEHSDELH